MIAPWLSDKFLRDVSKDIKPLMRPEDALLVWYHESRLRPSAVESSTGAAGLNQILPAYLKLRGIEPADYVTWEAEYQLPIVIQTLKEQLRIVGHGFPTAQAYAAANFLPAGAKRGTSDDTILASQNDKEAWSQSAYRSNSALDLDHKGAITIGDIRSQLDKIAKEETFQGVLSRFHALNGFSVPNSVKALGAAFVMVGALLIAKRNT